MKERLTSSTDRGKQTDLCHESFLETVNTSSSDKVILNNALDLDKGSSDIHSALKYFNSITEYMMQLRNVLGELRDDIE